ncbi:hypothetical protein [Streptomyces sp. NPDC046332]|uniref:hypothetical protein n=1 Tax=Streptomyces sp. NPDC046332 TaxID=3155133 RepID=UPI0033DCDD53
MGEEHLVTDDENGDIAEGFLAAPPWLGDATWGWDASVLAPTTCGTSTGPSETALNAAKDSGGPGGRMPR